MHAKSMHCWHGDIVCTCANIQIRGVPEDVHRRLKSEAGLAGQSLNEYLLARLNELSGTLSWPEFSALIREREPYHGPSTASIIREDRDSH